MELEDAVATDLKRATGFNSGGAADERKLNRVLQLTGFSDPVYAEAYVTEHQYDIVMDVTVGPGAWPRRSLLTSTSLLVVPCSPQTDCF